MVNQLCKLAGGVFFLTLILMASGCGSSNAQLRALQASPDETNGLNILVDGNTLFSAVALGAPTGYTSVSSGSHHLQVEVPGSTTPVIDETISLGGGGHYTFMTANFASSLTPVLLSDDKTAPSSGEVNIRAVHAGAGIGNVDVFILGPGNSPIGATPAITNLAFGAASSYQSLAAGSYEIFFNAAGGTTTYVDTGSLSFTAGQNRTIVLVPSAFGGFSWSVLPDLN